VNKRTQKGSVQDRKNCTATAPTKLGKTHVDYWATRIEKRTFKGRDGVIVTIPDWQVRCVFRRISDSDPILVGQ
jgi:hypothetical protein